jgi:hypothetical protein
MQFVLQRVIGFGALSSFVFSFFAELPFEPWAFLFPILFNIIALLLGTLSGIQLSLKLKSGAQTI